MNLPEIPQTWLIAFVFAGLITMRGFGIDTYVTAALGVVIGYLTGKHIEQQK